MQRDPALPIFFAILVAAQACGGTSGSPGGTATQLSGPALRDGTGGPTSTTTGNGGTGGSLSIVAPTAPSGASVRVYPADASGALSGPAPLALTYGAGARVWLTAPLRSGDAYFVGWRRNGADLDQASTTSVSPNQGDTFEAVYQLPSCSGIPVAPGVDSLLQAVASAPAGSTFCLKAGVHRFNSAVTARTGDVYIGEPGAVLRGTKVLTSFSRAGSSWVATGQTQQEQSSPASDCVSPATPRCIHPERTFIDDVELRPVGSTAELAAGTFFFDYANQQIYLYDDPTGHVVETTTGAGGIIGYMNSGSDQVTVKNLLFERFGGGATSSANHLALKMASGWIVENNELRTNSYVGVLSNPGILRNNDIHHNGRYGVTGTGLIEGNAISFNNTDGHDPNIDAGGTKFLHTSGLVVRGNLAESNTGNAFWSDSDNVNLTYENNVIENNTEAGINHEVSCAAVIRNNVVRGNNTALLGRSLWSGGEIYARSSTNLQIYGNAIGVAAGGNAVALRQDGSNTTPNCGTFALSNVSVHDNDIRLQAGSSHGAVGGAAGYSAANAIQFSGNTYHLPDTGGAYFWLDDVTRPMSATQWQAAGQDAAGQFLAQ